MRESHVFGLICQVILALGGAVVSDFWPEARALPITMWIIAGAASVLIIINHVTRR